MIDCLHPLTLIFRTSAFLTFLVTIFKNIGSNFFSAICQSVSDFVDRVRVKRSDTTYQFYNFSRLKTWELIYGLFKDFVWIFTSKQKFKSICWNFLVKTQMQMNLFDFTCQKAKFKSIFWVFMSKSKFVLKKYIK